MLPANIGVQMHLTEPFDSIISEHRKISKRFNLYLLLKLYSHLKQENKHSNFLHKEKE